MAYSDSFPAIRPSFQFSADAGRLDPRISYSRSTTGTYFGTEKHLSSENLFLQSSDFDTTWSKQGLEVPTGGQADPAGGTDGFTLEETAGANFHHIWQSPAKTGDLALTVYAKQNSGTRYVYLNIWNAVNDWQIALFDLAGNPPATANGSASTFTGVTATQTASGNGYYKCTLKATGTASVTYIGMDDSSTVTGYSTGYGVKSYTGDGTSSIDLAFASLTTTGATDYNATTTQIHREYAPTLQTAAINAPRFEYSPTDSASEAIGQSRGLLIEGSSTNLLNRSEEFDNAYWSKYNTPVTANAGVAPSGQLAGDLLVGAFTGSSTNHYLAKAVSFTSGTTYTLSVYVKAAGYTKFNIRAGNPAVWGVGTTFTLTGSGSASVTSGYGAIEACGNGWFRCSVTETAASTSATNVLLGLVDNSGNLSFDGDDYSGVLLWGAQMEAASFASSYIKVEGSTVTRAADSASASISQIGYSGGDLTLTTDATSQAPVSVGGLSVASIWKDNSNRVAVWNNRSDYRLALVNADGATATANDTVNQAGKTAVAVASGRVAACLNGRTVVNASSAAQIADLSGASLFIGKLDFSYTYMLDGHIKRIALYSEALSDTNLQALTS